MTRHPVVLAMALSAAVLLASTDAAAQAAGAGGSVLISPFDPPPVTGGDDPGGGGGGGYAPSDSGTPGGGKPPEPEPEPSGNDGAVRGGSNRAPDRSSPRGPARSLTDASAGRRSVTLGVDTWERWWETNKFDFIALRRIEDAPLSGQGPVSESAAARARRLEQVRTVVEGSVIPTLRDLTTAPDPAVRAAAIVSLGKLRDPQTAVRARALLGDPSNEVRRAAMLALGILDTGRAAYILMHIAEGSSLGSDLMGQSSPSDEQRGTALLASALRGHRQAEIVLERILDEPDEVPLELLASACDAAGLMGSLDAIHPLAAVARSDRWPEFVRSSAVTALGRIGDPAVVPILMEVLDDGLDTRRAAVVALGQAAHPGQTGVVEALAHVLDRAPDTSARHFAAIALGRIGGDAARAALGRAFDDASSDLRPWVALGRALAERDAPDASFVETLVEGIDREANVDTRGAYLVALGLCGAATGLPTLIEELRDGTVQTAGQAAVALGLTGHPDALPPLRAALRRARSPMLLRQIALGLGVLGNSAAVPDLLDLMRETSNPFVASFAAIGIAFMGDENAVGPLLHMIEREGPSGVTTTFAVTAVGQLFDVDRRPALSRLAAGDNYLARPDTVSKLLALGF